MPLPTVGYCSDEDIALRAGDDFSALTPRDQKLAYGKDGVFLAADRWTLGSATVDFAAQGVLPGMVCLLTAPNPTYKTPGETLAVDAVSAFGATLRRKGMVVSGVGQPPAPAAGLAGVEFTVLTLQPQIIRASYDLDRRYGVDDLVGGRRHSDEYDPTEVVEAVVLTVLEQRYVAMAHAGGEAADTNAAKAGMYRRELNDLLARVVVHWKGNPADPNDQTGIGNTKLSR